MRVGDLVHIYYSRYGSSRQLLTTGIYLRDEYAGSVLLHVVMENGTGRLCYVYEPGEDSRHKLEVVR